MLGFLVSDRRKCAGDEDRRPDEPIEGVLPSGRLGRRRTGLKRCFLQTLFRYLQVD